MVCGDLTILTFCMCSVQKQKLYTTAFLFPKGSFLIQSWWYAVENCSSNKQFLLAAYLTAAENCSVWAAIKKLPVWDLVGDLFSWFYWNTHVCEHVKTHAYKLFVLTEKHRLSLPRESTSNTNQMNQFKCVSALLFISCLCLNSSW